MTTVSVLRWIAVLPGALLAATLVHLIFSAANALAASFLGPILFYPADPNGIIGQFVSSALFGIVYAAAFVLSGEWIAPSRKIATRCVLAILSILLVGLSAIMVVIGMSITALLSEVHLITIPCTGIYFLVKAWRELTERDGGNQTDDSNC